MADTLERAVRTYASEPHEISEIMKGYARIVRAVRKNRRFGLVETDNHGTYTYAHFIPAGISPLLDKDKQSIGENPLPEEFVEFTNRMVDVIKDQGSFGVEISKADDEGIHLGDVRRRTIFDARADWEAEMTGRVWAEVKNSTAPTGEPEIRHEEYTPVFGEYVYS